MLNLIQSNINSTKIYSLKSKDFDSSVFNEFFKTEDTTVVNNKNYFKNNEQGGYDLVIPVSNPKSEGLYENKHFRSGLNTGLEKIDPNIRVLDSKLPSPDVNYNGVMVDNFCQKPAYIPKTSGKSIYYPLGDKIEGYDLQDFIYSDFIKAKGTCPQDDAPEYYQKNGNFFERLKVQPRAGDKVNKLFIKIDSMACDKANNDVRTVYYNPDFTNKEKYGKKINFSFDGIKPGHLDSGNLLKFNNNEISWISNWHDVNNIETSKNIYNTTDGLKLKVNQNSYFEKTINLTAGTYTFSCFMRLDDTVYYDNNIENVNERLIGNNRFGFSVSDVNKVDVVNVTYSNVNTDWNRKFTTFDIPSNGTYNIKIYCFKVGEEYKLPLKICGLMLTNTFYPKTYDHRGQDYLNTGVIDKVYPLNIYFLNEDRIKLTDSWTLCYERKINANTNKTTSGYLCVDSLGNDVHFGYEQNKAFIQIGNNEPVYKEINIDNFINQIEVVTLTFDFNTKKLSYLVTSNNDKYEILNLDVNEISFEGTLPDDTVKYNLLLGAVADTELDCLMSATYSDLMIFTGLLSKDEINKIIKTTMSFVNSKTYYESYTDSLDKDNLVVMSTKYELKELLTLVSNTIVETKNIGV